MSDARPSWASITARIDKAKSETTGQGKAVAAHVLNADGSLTSLGFFPDRKSAMGAVAEAAEARKRLADTRPGFVSGLPK
jgi:hypothetical protein